MNIIDDITRNTGIYLLKFDNKIGKYDGYIDKINYRVINITDSEIIEFYDIESLPTICVYKDKNLLDVIEGFLPKSELLKKIENIIK
jgi:thioredoxin-related protein